MTSCGTPSPSPCVVDSEEHLSGPVSLQRSASAPTSPITPPWTPPRRRRIASAEKSDSCWLDVHIAVDVVKDVDGSRELHCYFQAGDRTAHVAISLRRLLFWSVVLLFCLPAGAFQLMPRMPGMASRAPIVGSDSLTAPARLSRLDNITSVSHLPVEIDMTAAAAAAASYPASIFAVEESLPTSHSSAELLAESMSPLEPEAEHFMEEIEQCILDAASDDDFAACLQQVHTSTLDELSDVIVKEGCSLLDAADDGTVVGLLGHVLHTVKAEGLNALDVSSLRRLALRACVSASLHKMTVCAIPAVSACLVQAAPDAMHALNALLN